MHVQNNAEDLYAERLEAQVSGAQNVGSVLWGSCFEAQLGRVQIEGK